MAGIRGVLAALVVVLVAAGCAGSDETGVAISGAESTETTEATETSEATAQETTSTTGQEETTTTEPTTTTLTASGVAFASEISADGRAVDPGIEFSAGVNNVYAVFQADRLPPGIEVDVDDPEAGSYYAFLRPSASSSLSTFGWRWSYRGREVVEYEPDVTGGTFWLQRQDQSAAGIFGGDIAITGMGPGEYLVEFTASGNALFNESFTVAAG